MRSIAIVDAGPLVAVADAGDPYHQACVDTIRRRDLHLVVPALVVAEVAYLVGTRLDAASEAGFVRSLRGFAIETPEPDEWPAIADVVERYADFGLGTTDAATVVLADRLETDVIVTLDRRHFAAVQSPGGRRFRLLPEHAVHEGSAPYEAMPTP